MIVLDLAGAQSEAALAAIKEGKPYEGKNLAEIAREGLENFIHTQKKFLDLVLAVAQPKTNAKPGRKGVKAAERKELTALAKEGVETFVQSQQRLLALAASQIQETLKAAREVVTPSPEPSTSLGEFARRGAENFINAQKSLLDLATKTFAPHVTEHAHPAARRVRHA